MRAVIGIDESGKPIIWDPNELINPHVMITGITGSGKTHQLREFIRQIVSTAEHNVRVHLIDVHDDIEIDGASSLIFSQNSEHGYNPLVIDPDPNSGGVRRAIQNFLRLLSKI